MENLTDKVKAYWQVEKRSGDWDYLYLFYLYEVRYRGFFVPVKPVVQYFGLDWPTVRKDLVRQRNNLKPALIKTPSTDGKQRLMVCLPLPKLLDYLDHKKLDDSNHREIFKRENYEYRDFQPGGTAEASKSFKKRKRRAKKEFHDVGFVEFTSFLALRRRLETLDELLIMAGVRCFGCFPYTGYFKVDTEYAARGLLPMFDSLYYSMKDVCLFLGFSKYRDALKRINPEWIEMFEVETSGGIKSMSFISTEGVWELISKSRRPEMRVLKRRYFTPDAPMMKNR